MNELKEKERKAIEALRMFEPEDEPYFLCYSGGKDSDCIRILAQIAGVKHDIVHNLTTVDAPETIQYIKTIPGVVINKARYADGTHKTMWNLIPKKKFPPTRVARYCCAELKEQIVSVRQSVKSDNSEYLTGYVDALSAVEVMIDNEGQWQLMHHEYSVKYYGCSNCNKMVSRKYNYCPNCGKKMKNN